MLQDYSLSLDGPLLRRQRDLLIALTEDARNGRQVQLGVEQRELLEGLIELTDAIADQAHDHGIDCLIAEPSVETTS